MATHLIALSHRNCKELEGEGGHDLRFHPRSYICIHGMRERGKDHIPFAFNAEQELEAEIGEIATIEQPQS